MPDVNSPSSHHRHRASLEGVINFAAAPPFSSQQRDDAIRVFHAVIEACEPLHNQGPYKQITLVRLTYEYTAPGASRDNFLRFFLQHTEIPTETLQWELIQSGHYGPRLIAFADDLVEHFFLPLKASARKTPQPSPALSDLQSVQSVTGTTLRLANLRRDCLIRDRHRCVISRTFDRDEAVRRARRDNERARDDDGQLLKDEIATPVSLEVAHIIPHSLMAVPSGSLVLTESKKTAIAILNMFDDGVVHLIEGTDIDRPSNAITLTRDFHELFGSFEVYFEPQGDEPHTYRIDSFDTGFLRHRIFPVEKRTLFLTDTRTIDPPSPRLFAVHRAIAHILHLSGAGIHISNILYNLAQGEILADGSTELGHFVSLRIQGWWDRQVTAY